MPYLAIFASFFRLSSAYPITRLIHQRDRQSSGNDSDYPGRKSQVGNNLPRQLIYSKPFFHFQISSHEKVSKHYTVPDLRVGLIPFLLP
jgi:hypothetical protein